MTDADKRAYGIADNQIALHAGWNGELLAAELEALKGAGIDPATLGFANDELNKLLDGLERETRPDEDDVPEQANAIVTRESDVWQLGDHRLTCGDATASGAYSAVLGGEIAEMVFTDWPYNVAYLAPGLGVTIANDDLGTDFGPFLEKACRRILENTQGAIYLCMSSSELHTLYSAFTNAGGHWSTTLIWGKNNFTLGRADYQRQFEPISYGWREGQPHYWCGARDQGDLWLIDRPTVNDLHPTMKPVALIERAVMNSSRRGEIVLDPFAGSGSTAIACEKTGRQARLIEIEPCYCDVIVRRWEQFTGKQAILEATGASFAEVGAERARDESPSDGFLPQAESKQGLLQ